MNFEKAPFKMTTEFVSLLDGVESKMFKRFRTRMVEGYKALHEHAEKLMVLVEMIGMNHSDLPCFE